MEAGPRHEPSEYPHGRSMDSVRSWQDRGRPPSRPRV